MKHHIHNPSRFPIHCANCPCEMSSLVTCTHKNYVLWGDAEIFLKSLTDECWDWP
jgi:hypothetical protein